MTLPSLNMTTVFPFSERNNVAHLGRLWMFAVLSFAKKTKKKDFFFKKIDKKYK